MQITKLSSNTLSLVNTVLDSQYGEILLTHLPLDKMAAILADDIFKCFFLNENDRILNGRHFGRRHFQMLFLEWNDRILIQISLKFVPMNPIDNKPALVQVMAWRRIGDKPLPEPVMAQFTDAYMRHYGEMS